MASRGPTGARQDEIIKEMYKASLRGHFVNVLELAARLHVKENTISYHLGMLARDFLSSPSLVIESPRLRGQWMLTEAGIERGIFLHNTDNLESPRGIRLLGKIAAGPAIRFDSDYPEEYIADAELDPTQHAAFRVDGRSMIDYGIWDNDRIIVKYVDSWMNVRPNNIVAMLVPEGTQVISEDYLQRLLIGSSEGNEPAVDHITLKAMTGDNILEMCQSIESMNPRAPLTGSNGRTTAIAFQVYGVLKRQIRDH